MSVCDFIPFPGNGAYGHWRCERPRHHMGRHRFHSYTIARIPHVWRLRQLRACYRTDRRMRRLLGKTGYGYRRALFPTRYEPVRYT